MKIIKISTARKTWPFNRQTLDGNGAWGDYKFVFDDIEECDAWVVIGGISHSTEICKCPRDKVMLINDEPPTMRSYTNEYLSQFSIVATCGGYNFKHPDIRLLFPLLPWYAGVHQKRIHVASTGDMKTLTYRDFIIMEPPEKTKLMSVVFSNVDFTAGHKKRRDFINGLKNHFGDSLDIYGRGFNFVEDKLDAIQDYKYHIVVENSQFPHYWTEKISDAYLGWSFPFYCGCPNINDYFSPQSFGLIDINDLPYSISRIEYLISQKTWERSLKSIRNSRDKVLNDYNMFPKIIELLGTLDEQKDKDSIKIKSIKSTNEYLLSKLRKAKNSIKNFICPG